MPSTRPGPRARELLSLAVLAASAHAQTLELGAPPEPPPGQSRALLALVDQLADEASRLGSADERARARAALRTLAVSIAPGAASPPERAFAAALLARTIAARRADLDALIARAAPEDAWLAAALLERLAASPPERPGDLERRLRDALAPLARAVEGSPGPGWVPIEPGPRATPGEVPTPLAAPLARALDHPAYAPSANRVLALLTQATSPLPAFLTPQARANLDAALENLAADLLNETARTEAIGRLERLAAWHALLGQLVEDSRDQALASARQRVNAHLASGAGLDDDPGPTRALRAAAELLDDRPFERVEQGLAAPHRPVRGRLGLRRHDYRRRLLEDLDRLLATPRPLTDPAVLARFDACRRAADALTALGTLSRTLTGVDPRSVDGPRPRLAPEYDALARRLLELARGLERDDDADESSALVEALAAWSSRHAEWPGEAALRAGDAPLAAEMTRLAGAAPEAILREIDRARARWLAAWVGAPSASQLRDADATAEAERPAFALLHDAATLAPILRGESPLRANEWPALELSPAALTRLCEDLEPHAREAWNTLAQGRPPSPPSAHAPARLIAAVERRLAAFPPTNATRAAFDELAAGAPVDTLTWGLAARDAIARFCALAEDAASGDATLLSAAGSHAAEALILLGEQ